MNRPRVGKVVDTRLRVKCEACNGTGQKGLLSAFSCTACGAVGSVDHQIMFWPHTPNCAEIWTLVNGISRQNHYCYKTNTLSIQGITINFYLDKQTGKFHQKEINGVSPEREKFIKRVEAIAEDISSEGEWSFACIASAMYESGDFELKR